MPRYDRKEALDLFNKLSTNKSYVVPWSLRVERLRSRMEEEAEKALDAVSEVIAGDKHPARCSKCGKEVKCCGQTVELPKVPPAARVSAAKVMLEGSLALKPSAEIVRVLTQLKETRAMQRQGSYSSEQIIEQLRKMAPRDRAALVRQAFQPNGQTPPKMERLVLDVKAEEKPADPEDDF